jgi:hypothetical protein
MPPRRRKRKKERVALAVNHDKAREIFKLYGMPEENLKKACDRLDDLVAVVRTMESDLQLETSVDLTGKAPKQRNRFRKIADQLEGIANEILVLDQSRQRYRKERDAGYIPPVGAEEFKRAVSGVLFSLFDSNFLVRHGIEMPSPPEYSRQPRPLVTIEAPQKGLNQYQREGIKIEAIGISADILRRLAQGISNAADLVKADTRRGPPQNPIREVVLINLIKLWHDGFNGKRGIYKDAQDLIGFCEDLCNLLEVPSYCSERHLETAVKEFNRRSRKPRSSNR